MARRPSPGNARRPTSGHGPDRSGQDGVASWVAAAAAAVAVVVVAGGAWAIAASGGDDSSSTTTDPGTTPTVTASIPSSPASSSPTSGGEQPQWSRQCARAATSATKSGFAVLAPSELPAGWKLGVCRYDATSGWHLEVRTGSGTLAVDQQRGAVAPLVVRVLGHDAKRGAVVHVAGTGSWQSWTGDHSARGLSKPLASTAALVSGSRDTGALRRLADVLLTYENAPPGENGG